MNEITEKPSKEQVTLETIVSGGLPDNEEIIDWANKAELTRGHEHLSMTTSQKTAYIQGRCDGARWMKSLIGGIPNKLKNEAKRIKSEGFKKDEISEKVDLIRCLEVTANYLNH